MTILLYLLFGLSILTLLRVLLGPSVWDRILAFNLFTAKFLLILLILDTITGQSYLLDIAFVYVLLGFISVVFIARFIQRKGKI